MICMLMIMLGVVIVIVVALSRRINVGLAAGIPVSQESNSQSRGGVPKCQPSASKAIEPNNSLFGAIFILAVFLPVHLIFARFSQNR